MSGDDFKIDGKIAQYSTNDPANHPEFDEGWLEETHLRGPSDWEVLEAVRKENPRAIRDLDGDGYREIHKGTLDEIVKRGDLPAKKQFRLAPYFDDRKGGEILADQVAKLSRCSVGTLYSCAEQELGLDPPLSEDPLDHQSEAYSKKMAHALVNTLAPGTVGGTKDSAKAERRLRQVPKDLKKAVQDNDPVAARKYFSNLVKRLKKKRYNPLKMLSEVVSAYLSASLTHPGVNWSGNAVDKNGAGLSVHDSGRLRADCEGHAQWTVSALKDIKGIRSHFVTMSRKPVDPSQDEIGDGAVICHIKGGCDLMKEYCSRNLTRDVYQCKDKYHDPIFGVEREKGYLGVFYYDHHDDDSHKRTFLDPKDWPSSAELTVKKGEAEYERRLDGRKFNLEGYEWKGSRRGYREIEPCNEWERVGRLITCEGKLGNFDDNYREKATYRRASEEEVADLVQDSRWSYSRNVASFDTGASLYGVFIPENNQYDIAHHLLSPKKWTTFNAPQPESSDKFNAHMISVSTLGDGYLIQDNNKFRYVDLEEGIWEWIKHEYKDQGYKYFSRTDAHAKSSKPTEF